MAGDNVGSSGGRKRPSLRNTVYFQTSRGQTYARKWPRKQPNQKGKAKEHQEWFGQVNRLFDYLIPQQQIAYIQAAKGSVYYPRDLHMSMVAGRVFYLYDPFSGRTIYPMAALRDVSASLDVISSDKGVLLARDTDLWSPLAPGAQGTVLTSAGPGALPQWLPASGGGGTVWTLRASWQWSVDVPSVVFNGLTDADDILCIAYGLGQSSTSAIQWHVSTDDGANWWATSGDYVTTTATSGAQTAQDAALETSNASPGTRMCAGLITSVRQPAPALILPALASLAAPRLFVANLVNPIDAVRLSVTAGNLTAGSAFVLTR